MSSPAVSTLVDVRAAGADPQRPVPFRILYVCVANMCRSVLAERLTRRELDRHVSAQPVEVSSAGTRSRPGGPMHPSIARLLSTLGADPTGFSTRRISPAVLGDADLILTATTRERDDVVGLLPASLRRTFTITEFARLACRVEVPGPRVGTDRVTRARRIVTAALALRGRVPVDVPLYDGRPLPDDIVDPVPTVDAFQECGAVVQRAVRIIVDALIDPPEPS